MAEFVFLGINGSLQSAGSGNTSLLVRSGGSAMAVDLSCNLQAAVEAEPEAVVLTHEHIDHVYGLPSFLHQSWLRGRKKPLDVYIPSGMEGIPEGMISLFNLRGKKGIFDIRVLTADSFALGRAEVRFFKTDHTATSLGMIIGEGGRRLVYTGDTRPIPASLKPAAGADVLIHESSGLEADGETLVKKGHSSGADAARLAAALGAKRLFICHLPPEREKAEMILAEAKGGFANAFMPEVMKAYGL